jgi:branched-chain amino acid transport system permease protein
VNAKSNSPEVQIINGARRRRALSRPKFSVAFAGSVVVLLIILGLTAIPLWIGGTFLGIMVLVWQAVPGCAALNVLQGLGGQVSIGNAAFMGIGAMTAGVLTTELKLPFLACCVLGGLVAGVIGAVVGLPALRIRGLQLVVGTLAFQYVASYAMQSLQDKLVGAEGFLIPIAKVGSLTIYSNQSWYLLLAGFGLVVLFAMRNLRRSRTGRALLAIRTNEVMAGTMGVPVSRTIFFTFAGCSALIGVQGVLYAYYLGVSSYDQFTLTLALSFVIMIIIGGEGSPLGSFLGAFFVIGLPFVVTWLVGVIPGLANLIGVNTFDIQEIIFGIVIVLFLIFEPAGLSGLCEKLVSSAKSLFRIKSARNGTGPMPSDLAMPSKGLT